MEAVKKILEICTTEPVRGRMNQRLNGLRSGTNNNPKLSEKEKAEINKIVERMIEYYG